MPVGEDGMKERWNEMIHRFRRQITEVRINWDMVRVALDRFPSCLPEPAKRDFDRLARMHSKDRRDDDGDWFSREFETRTKSFDVALGLLSVYFESVWETTPDPEKVVYTAYHQPWETIVKNLEQAANLQALVMLFAHLDALMADCIRLSFETCESRIKGLARKSISVRDIIEKTSTSDSQRDVLRIAIESHVRELTSRSLEKRVPWLMEHESVDLREAPSDPQIGTIEKHSIDRAIENAVKWEATRHVIIHDGHLLPRAFDKVAPAVSDADVSGCSEAVSLLGNHVHSLYVRKYCRGGINQVTHGVVTK